MGYPDFLCIGAQKSGTGWLNVHLRDHPELWLPPFKEIHHFDRGKTPYVAQLFSIHRTRRNRAVNQVKTAYGSLRASGHSESGSAGLRWYLRYFLMPRTDSWYQRLFVPSPGQIAGELTPAYAILDAEKVSRIAGLMPELKIIYLLRNPVDRVWSQALMHHYRAGKGTRETVDESFMEHFLSEVYPYTHSSYSQSLEIWQDCIPDGQLFIGFFEEIAQSPRQLLLDIFRFLEISDSGEWISPDVHVKVHSSKQPHPMPPVLRRKATERLMPDIIALDERLGNHHTRHWLKSAENVLRQSTD